MSHFRVDLRDMKFVMFEQCRLQDLLGRGPFAAYDQDTMSMMVDEAVATKAAAGAAVVVTGSVVGVVANSSGRCVSSEPPIKTGIAIAALTATTTAAIRRGFFLVTADGVSSEDSVS